jgi:RNA polymerase sigma-70 factor, ECF subfamily
MKLEDQDLLQRAQAYDDQALAEIYDRWSPGLYRYAMRLLDDADLAEECVAETFQRLLMALQQGNGPKDSLQAYLYRIAHNWVTDIYRRSPRQPVPLPLDLQANSEHEPPSVVTQNLERQKIQAALACLTPDQRQVIMLKYLEDWNHQEIARALNKPVGAIKSLQHRALNTLKHILLRDEAISNEPE